MQKSLCFMNKREKHSCCQWRRAVFAMLSARRALRVTLDSVERSKLCISSYKYSKSTTLSSPIHGLHDSHTLHLVCNEQQSKYWQSHLCRIIGQFSCKQSRRLLVHDGAYSAILATRVCCCTDSKLKRVVGRHGTTSAICEKAGAWLARAFRWQVVPYRCNVELRTTPW